MHEIENREAPKKCCSLSVHRLIFKDFLLRHNEKGVCRQQKIVPVLVVPVDHLTSTSADGILC